MELGVTFPQTEVGTDPDRIARFARTVEECGYGHLLAYDHVLGADADREGGLSGPYDHTDAFHEPLTLFSHLAGLTEELTFVTGVLVLPQRQTALVAKQAAQVDVLSSGRLRLAVGVGWNPHEYAALDQLFERRGQRIEEQLEVLRRLWTENPTRFEGEFHDLPGVGINPLPVQRPIPLWMGGTADIVLKRIARTADGWIPLHAPDERTREQLATLREYAEAEGRSPDDVGVHGRLQLDTDDADELVERVETWRELGADYLSVVTLNQAREPDEHVEAVERFADAMADAGIELSD